MNITTIDLAGLSDAELKATGIGLLYVASEETGPIAALMRSFAIALKREIRARRVMFLHLEADAMNDDGPGALVPEGDTQEADAS